MFLLLFALLTSIAPVTSQYTPNWSSLDSRPLPEWYDRAKIGIFLHWGVYSVPCFGSEWFWWNWQGVKDQRYIDYMKRDYPPGFTYAEFAPSFDAKFFNPSDWAKIFHSSGAKYIVLTSKHHEGFTLWPSQYSFNWNAKDVGPHRDLIDELSKAVRNAGLKFGLYHSLYEWFNPLYLQDKQNGFRTQQFVRNKILPEMRELVTKYQPSVLWSDGDWETSDTYWNSTEFLAWLYNDSPVKDEIVSNDRWGSGTLCTHGGFFTCSDRFNPGVLQKHKWENAMTIDRASWGYRCDMQLSNVMSIEELIQQLVKTVSCGGNLLMNVGPTASGEIPLIFQERLSQMGEWLTINGDAIYNTKPWRIQNDTKAPNVWYTSKRDTVYAVLLEWPTDGKLTLDAPVVTDTTSVSMLGSTQLPFERIQDKMALTLPMYNLARIPSRWAWVLKLNDVK